MLYIIILPLYFLVMSLYFKVADHYNIIDHPNERSSHSQVTIRGGGVIFLFAAFVMLIMHLTYWLPMLGVLVIGAISFLDDRHTISSKLRILFHLAAVTLLFLFLNIFQSFPYYYYIALYILFIGIINAYNFMDGINGITGLYSLVILGGLQYVNLRYANFTHPDMIWLPVIGCAVFLYYNFRKKARCFAGDVGSVSMAFWITFLILSLIITTHQWHYILFLAVYGVDSILTIIHRIMLKQNIFKAHRLHLYQLLVNEQKLPHRLVSSLYALIQLIIMVLVIRYHNISFTVLFFSVVSPLAVTYILLKPWLMKKT